MILFFLTKVMLEKQKLLFKQFAITMNAFQIQNQNGKFWNTIFADLLLNLKKNLARERKQNRTLSEKKLKEQKSNSNTKDHIQSYIVSNSDFTLPMPKSLKPLEHSLKVISMKCSF